LFWPGVHGRGHNVKSKTTQREITTAVTISVDIQNEYFKISLIQNE